MSLIKNITSKLLSLVFEVEENHNKELGLLYRILIIRQHNQLGDLLISTPIFRALKEKYPYSDITAIVSPANHKALEGNFFIDHLFIFDKRRIFEFSYLKELRSVLKRKYDAVIVPSVTSISFTSNLLARLAKAETRIGPKSLNGKINSTAFFFDRRIDLDWRDKPDTHVSQRNLDIIKPFGIETDDLTTIIHSGEKEDELTEKFINQIPGNRESPLIGFHIGAGKIQNRWNHTNFAKLIDRLMKDAGARVYLTQGNEDDKRLNSMVNKNTDADLIIFDLPGMPVLKSLIEKSNLFITNDTGPMHAAAATNTKTISLFGPTNPGMWAPQGEDKHFLWNGEDINNISVDDVYNLTMRLII